jgi:hypothetical protein
MAVGLVALLNTLSEFDRIAVARLLLTPKSKPAADSSGSSGLSANDTQSRTQ